MKNRKAVDTAAATSKGVVYLVFSTPMVTALAVALLAPWGVLMLWLASGGAHSPLTLSSSSASGSGVASAMSSTGTNRVAGRRTPSANEQNLATGRVQWCKPGPWGQIELTRVSLEMPSEFIFLGDETGPLRWFIGGVTRDEALAKFSKAGLTPQEFESLSQPEFWEETAMGAWVTPPADLLLSMNPAARAKIYNSLSIFEQNEAQRSAFTYRPDLLDERIERSGLSAETVAMFRRLLYPRGQSLLFADALPMLDYLRDDEEERRRFVKTISRKVTVLGRLRVDESSDIDELVRYWGVGGRSKDLRPLLESLQRVEGGCYIDIVHLLPAFARRRIYTFPVTTEESMALQPDCHWTAMNFFNDPPDDRFATTSYAASVVRSEYSVIANPGQLGDMVFITDPSGGAIHSAVYIADDLVFTKNGARFTEPWSLMSLSDMLDVYLASQPADAPLKVVYFRHNRL